MSGPIIMPTRWQRFKGSVRGYVKQKLPERFREALAVVGAGTISFGFWLAWAPLGFIVFGAFALGLSILLTRGSEGK